MLFRDFVSLIPYRYVARKACGEMMSKDKALGLASLRVLHLSGIIRMPFTVQTHLRLCDNDPRACLLCQMTQLQIERLRR
jgi:hypothetical protein